MREPASNIYPPFQNLWLSENQKKKAFTRIQRGSKRLHRDNYFRSSTTPAIAWARRIDKGGRCSCCQCVRSFHSRPTLPRSVTHRLWDKWATLVSEHHLRGRKTNLEGGGNFGIPGVPAWTPPCPVSGWGDFLNQLFDSLDGRFRMVVVTLAVIWRRVADSDAPLVHSGAVNAIVKLGPLSDLKRIGTPSSTKLSMTACKTLCAVA
jgi:hypothetical protein